MDVDPMAALDAAMGAKKPAFVAAKERTTLQGTEKEAVVENADEIALEEDDDEE